MAQNLQRRGLPLSRDERRRWSPAKPFAEQVGQDFLGSLAQAFAVSILCFSVLAVSCPARTDS